MSVNSFSFDFDPELKLAPLNRKPLVVNQQFTRHAEVPDGFVRTQGLAHMIVHAYSNHYDLVISPDDVLLAITAVINKHIEHNAEALRSRFVNHQGKEHIVLCLQGGLSSQNWTSVTEMFHQEVAKRLVDPQLVDWMIPRFTTSTAKTQLVANLTLMSAVKAYFSFECMLLCGLRRVTLLGTKDDWIKLRTLAEQVTKFELPGDTRLTRWFEDQLKPVLDEFVNFRAGQVNRDWWDRICSFERYGSGGDKYIHGWVTAFSPFNGSDKWIADKPSGRFLSFHKVSSYMSCLINVPVKITDLIRNEEYQASFYGVPGMQIGATALEADYAFLIIDQAQRLAVNPNRWPRDFPEEEHRAHLEDQIE